MATALRQQWPKAWPDPTTNDDTLASCRDDCTLDEERVLHLAETIRDNLLITHITRGGRILPCTMCCHAIFVIV